MFHVKQGGAAALFADAEIHENDAENVLDVDAAGDAAERPDREPHIFRRKFGSGGGCCAVKTLDAALKGKPVARLGEVRRGDGVAELLLHPALKLGPERVQPLAGLGRYGQNTRLRLNIRPEIGLVDEAQGVVVDESASFGIALGPGFGIEHGDLEIGLGGANLGPAHALGLDAAAHGRT